MTDKLVNFRASDEEKASLQAQAAKGNLSLTAFIRAKLGLEQPRSTAPRASTKRWVCLHCNTANFSTSCSRCALPRP